MTVYDDAVASSPQVQEARAAVARLREHAAANTIEQRPNLTDPYEAERLIVISVRDAARAGSPLPDLAQLAARVADANGYTERARQAAAAILGRAVQTVEHDEGQAITAGTDDALRYLADRLADLLDQAADHVAQLGDVRIDDDPRPIAEGSIDGAAKTVHGFTPIWRRPGQRIRRADATPAQTAAWDALDGLAAQYRDLRAAQAKILRRRLNEEAARPLRYAGELADLATVWPDWDLDGQRDAEPAPWGEQIPRGTSAGADFIAWAALQRSGVVWMPSVGDMKAAAEEAQRLTAVRARVRAGGSVDAPTTERELTNAARAVRSMRALNQAATGTQIL